MASCSVCDTEDITSYDCSYCGNTYCVTHRLPEDHDCPELESTQSPSTLRQQPSQSSASTDGTAAGSTSNSPTDDLVAGNRQQSVPKKMENVPTYGGSGKDSSKADFESGPDVALDGSIDGEQTMPLGGSRRHTDRISWITGERAVLFILLAAGIALLLALYF